MQRGHARPHVISGKDLSVVLEAPKDGDAGFVQSKLVATLGPSSHDVETLVQMLRAGAVASTKATLCAGAGQRPLAVAWAQCSMALAHHAVVASLVAFCRPCSSMTSSHFLSCQGLHAGFSSHGGGAPLSCLLFLGAGMSVARVDLTWGSLDYHKRSLRNLNTVSDKEETMGRRETQEGGNGALGVPYQRGQLHVWQAASHTCRNDMMTPPCMIP